MAPPQKYIVFNLYWTYFALLFEKFFAKSSLLLQISVLVVSSD